MAEKLIYQGKTKDVYENADGTYTLLLKDDATGKDGVFDPGENTVGLSVAGLGRSSLRLSQYYFEKIKEAGIPTHFIGCDIALAKMHVLPATMFGQGLEFICRRYAAGSFLKRYGAYTKMGDKLDYLVEVTLKDDARQDPFITKETVVQLGIMTAVEYERCVAYAKNITKIIADDLSQKGLNLYDIKFEFGKNADEIMLIDEVSAGCMRVYHNGEAVAPLELGNLILGQ